MRIPEERIFISCVSAEFRSYREELRKALNGPTTTIKIQEDFNQGSGQTLQKLEAYIRQCQAVLHIVGDGCGAQPQEAEVIRFLEDHPSFADELGLDAALLDPSICNFSYTQWEAYLALYYKANLYIYVALNGSQREAGWTPVSGDTNLQQAHLERLRGMGLDRDEEEFEDFRDISIKFMRSRLDAYALGSNNARNKRRSVEWPELDKLPAHKIADRHDEFEKLKDLLSPGSPSQFLFLYGASQIGKSVIAREIENIILQIDGIEAAHADFKAGSSIDSIVADLVSQLSGTLELNRFERDLERNASGAANIAFLHDLRETELPIVITLDTFEQATEEAKRWITGQLFRAVAQASALKLIVLGQSLPDYDRDRYSEGIIIEHKLKPIVEPAYWKDYLTDHLRFGCSGEVVEAFVQATEGNPAILDGYFRNLRSQEGA